jgi:bifunctional non-homologous end joining protein LigD
MIGMHFIEPCLPTISRTVPTGPQWAYEIKHDGFRFLAVRQGKQVRIYSRGGHDWSERVPAIADALLDLPVRSVMLDGEGVICGADGKSDFDAMRVCFTRQGAPEAFLYAFDVLELDGRDLRSEPWARRRDALVQLLVNADSGIRLCEHIEDADGAVVFRAACNLGLWSPSTATVAIARAVPASGSRSRTRPIRRLSAQC